MRFGIEIAAREYFFYMVHAANALWLAQLAANEGGVQLGSS
jgi:hypothetical protein